MPRKSGLRDESGQVLIISALSMTVLLGFVAMAIDVGLLFRAKRNIQIAADAAATAGALDFTNTSSSDSVKKAAAAAATANGFTDGAGGVHVTINNPVTSGAHTGPGTVEALITQPNPTFFMRVLGRSSMTVGARAVAGQTGASACIYLMGTGLDLPMNGSATIEGWNLTKGIADVGCGIYSNGDVVVKGASNTINMAFVAAAGTVSGTLNTGSGPVIQHAPVESIPSKLQITAPAPTSSTFGGSCGLPTGTTCNLKKGVYTCSITSMSPNTCYGIDGVSGASALNLTISNATLSSGIYGFDLGSGGKLTLDSGVSGGNPAQGSGGVTLDVYTGDFSIANTSDTLYAPSNGGTYDGVLLLEPPTNTGSINLQWGSSSFAFTGIIDAPGANATLQDNGGGALVTGLVVGSLTSGPSTLKVANYADVYSNSPFQSVVLVE